jgi:hypothetical protein
MASPTRIRVRLDVVTTQKLQGVERRPLNVDKVILNIGIVPTRSVHHEDVRDHHLVGLGLPFRVKREDFLVNFARPGSVTAVIAAREVEMIGVRNRYDKCQRGDPLGFGTVQMI